MRTTLAAVLLGGFTVVPTISLAADRPDSHVAQPGIFGSDADEIDAVDTQLELSSQAAGNIHSFDVAGFKLGMSLKEANRVASKAGFQRMPLRGHRNFSFEGRARLIANHSLSQKLAIPAWVPEHSGAIASGDRKLLIDWLPTAQGVRVRRLSYSAPTEGNDPASVLKQVEQKYGPATSRRGNELTWCSAKFSDCSGFTTQRPRMIASVQGGKLLFLLDAGTIAKDENESAIKARAAQLTANRAKPVSF